MPFKFYFEIMNHADVFYCRFYTTFASMFRKGIFIMCLASALTVSASRQATADSVRTPHQLREIEVLGVKQMPQEGPLPATKLNRTTINRLNIESVKDLCDIVPNLYTPSYGSRMTSSIYMRGLGSRIDQAVVGLNIDGVPFLNKDSYDFDIPDIWSIEVLRGAQSVLNGRNAMAGQINIYTLSPRDIQGMRLMAEYGRGNSANASVSGYFKLSEKLYTSLTAFYGHTDGFWDNEYNGKPVGLENNASLRWKTIWTPSRALSITNTASYSLARQSGYPYASVESGKIAYNDTCFYRRNSFADGLTIAWAGKRVVVTSLTSVQYLDDNMTLDQDFTTDDYFTISQRRHELTFTEDLFTKGSRGNYSWLGGVFGFYRDTDMQAPVTFYDTGISNLIEEKRNQMNPAYPIKWDSREFLLDSRFKTPAGGFALYHQSTYNLGDWTFDLGLRWEIENVRCNYDNEADASYTTKHVKDDGTEEFYSNTPVNIHENDKLQQTFDELLPKVVVTRSLPFGTIYASFTKGYKAGGYNTQMFSDVLQQKVMELMGLSMLYDVEDIVTYRPETSWNYELGIRSSLFDNRLKAEAVGYFIDCHDQQLTVFPPGTVTGRIMTNAGRTWSFGAELSAQWMPSDDFTMSASYGYNNAKFKEYNNGRQDLSGKRVPYAPAHTLFASATWLTPWHPCGMATEFSINVRGAGDIMWNEENTLQQNFYALPGASFSLKADKWSLKIWGENLTDTRYDTFYFLSMGNAFVQHGKPITFGATLRINLNNI